ncbi:TonB-dependent receptor domain-containing protein [Dinghuibacter silviterrae]|uniref:Outer membrane receptor protein involved in Fe transport n=1 Tax=Dinghuibacter silviterrae TaxID=1539049 RepID=A0A4R8DHC2_9BACT|nr:TonB-dependent receptor [Dinghuibacter silviterrae]TDW96907.1 outer membrane receptor protein involved in Fe transport [Dinghuibacter silviterrae]
MIRPITLLLLTVFCHIQLIASAQNANVVKGQVNDENGQPVTSASVFAKNQSTGLTTATQTDSLGIFTYRNLPAGGPYSFVVSHVGFQTQTISGYTIKADADISLLIKLKAVENGLNEIIVTGRAGALNRTKLQTSYSVTSIGYNALSLQGPTSVTESLKSVPGFWVEATGGEASGNIRARGVPVDGFGSIQLMEDGIPVQHDPALGYLNADQAFRLDETIQSIEVVRGGPSSVFYSNAPAGAVNYIPRAVGDKTEGVFKLSLGGDNLMREDVWVGAPIGDDWKISAGGFYRTESGVRNPGYTGNHGGQFRVSLGKSWEKTSFNLDFKQMNDDVVFYTDMPMTYNSKGKIVAVSGFDGNYGAIAGAETQRMNMIQADSSLYHFDNTVGTSVNRSQVTVKFQTEFSDNWILKNSLRFNNTQTQRNGVYALNLLTADSFYKAQAPLLTQAPGAQQLGFQYVTTGKLFDNAGQNGNGMVIQGGLRGITMPMTEVMNDLHLSHVFVTGSSKHDFNLGYYYAHFSQNFSRYSSKVYLDVQNNSRLLNIVALDGNGNIVHTYSNNGVSQYGYEWADANGEQTTNALYVSDEWQITHAFRLDGGLRWENAQTDGVVEQSQSVNLGTYATSSITTGNGVWQGYNHHFNYTTWTLGADYQLSENMGLFGRYTSAARIPGFGTYYTNVNANAVIQTMELGEVGFKYARRLFAFYGTGFWTKYNNVGFTNEVSTLNGFTSVNANANTQTFGLELEGALYPVKWFDVSATATYQHGVYEGYEVDAVSGGTLTQKANYDGNQLIRVPHTSIRAVPGFNLFRNKLRLQSAIEYEGKRYTDVANSQVLPAYTKVDIDASVKLTKEITVFGVIDNLTNSLGLTEGNPRQGEIQSAEANQYIFLARPLLGRSFKISFRYKF